MTGKDSNRRIRMLFNLSLTCDHPRVFQETHLPDPKIPSDFIEYLHRVLPDLAISFLDGLSHERKTSVRVNSLKLDASKARSALEAAGFRIRPLDFYNDAWRIEDEPRLVSKTLEHFLGLIYIQGVASMIPPLVLNPSASDLVLDISAAPGSKTTQLAQIMKNRGCIVANDWDGKRIKTLSHNLDRMGILNTAMVHMPGERIGTILPETFDHVLVDAPCSSIGVIHKAPEAVENLKFVQKYSYIQEQLLISGLKALKPGGAIVYSTCTITPEENEKLIDQILKRYPVEIIDIKIHPSLACVPAKSTFPEWSGDPCLNGAVRLLPSEVNPEGFFIAHLRKKDSIDDRPSRDDFPNRKTVHTLIDASDKIIRQMAGYFEDRFGISSSWWDHFLFHVKEDEILVASSEWLDRSDLLNRIFTHRVGTRVARTRREGEWKLSTNAAQLFGHLITKNRIDLSEPGDIETYIDGGIVRKNFGIERGGVVVGGNGYVLGCGVIHQGALKSQMPKSRKVLAVDL